MKVSFSLISLLTLVATTPAQNFSDNFTRGTNPGTIAPWIVQAGNWSTTNGVGYTGPNPTSSYAQAYVTNNFTNCTVQGSFRFPVGAYGGGLGGRVSPSTGARYAAWIYPENSLGGSNVLRLIKFQNWSSFVPMQQTNLASVGTNLHTLRLTISSNVVSVYYDAALMITVTDADAPHASGTASLEMWTDATPYVMSVDDVSGTAIGNAPVANPDSYAAVKGRTLTVAAPGVLANDTGGVAALRATLVTTVTNGTLSLSTNGGFTYTPSAASSVGDRFTYRATDGVSNSSTVTVGITISTNRAPVSVNDNFSLTINSSLTVPGPGVLANDTDADNDNLTASVVSSVTNGTLSLNSNGGFTYTPPANFTGADRFTYRANDGLSNSATATVNLSVVAVGSLFFDGFTRSNNPGPIAPWLARSGNWIVDTGVMAGGTNTAMSYGYAYLTNVWNDYTVEANVRFPSNSFGGGIGGRLNSTNGAHYGAWIYPENSPGGGLSLKLIKFSAWESFSYLGVPNQVMQQVSLPSVGTGNHKLKLAFAGSRIGVYLDGILQMSVTDGEAVPHTSGGVCLEFWTDAIQYGYIADDVAVSPLASDDTYALVQDSSLTVAAPGVLVNDTGVYGTSLASAVVSNPTNGLLSLSTNGGFTYTPNAGYFGNDTFRYRLSDGVATIGTGLVNLAISKLNRAPVFPVQSNRTIVELTTLTVTNTATDQDVPPDALTYQLISPPAGATISSNGVITWATTESQGPSTSTISTRVTDSGTPPNSVTNSFTVVVTESNLPPTLPVQVDRVVNELTQLTVTNTATDLDLPANPMTYQILTGPTNASINSQGIITWTPTESQGPGTNLFEVTVSDNGSPPFSVTNDFTVVVSEVNSAPVLPAQVSRTIAPLTYLVITNTAVDTDIPIGTLLYSLDAGPTNATISPTGVIEWTPATGQNDTTNLFRTIVTDNGTPALRATNTFIVYVNLKPVFSLESSVVVDEGCYATNGAVDPGEAVTMVFSLRNTGTGNSTNLVVTLLSSNGVSTPSGPQSVGVVSAGGGTASAVFSFVSTGSCGDTITPRLALQDGSANMGEVLTNLTLGIRAGITQNFDAVTIPALPAGWTTTPSQALSGWVTQSTVRDTVPNVAYVANAAAVGSSALVSPIIALPAGSSQLTFRHSYSFEANPSSSQPGYDGGVLEIKIGSGNFVDILAAGGSFVSGGYNRTISTAYQNPIQGRQAWSATNGSFATVVVNLPSASQGQNIQLRWLAATDNGGPVGQGWRVDGIGIGGLACCQNTAPVLAQISDVAIPELSLLTVTNVATDATTPVGGLSYALENPPLGAQINQQGVISWNPTEAQGPGTNLFRTIVTDNGNPPLSATNEFTVTVAEVNLAPVLSEQTDRFLLAGQLITVTNGASDLDQPANLLNYALVAAPSGAQIDSAGVITWTVAPDAGSSTNLITTVVTDNGTPALSATNSFVVFVDPSNIPPTLPPQANRQMFELETMQVTNSASDASALTYELVNAPAGSQISTAGIITWTPGEIDGPGTNTFITVVTDDGVPPMKATNSFAVVVLETNSAPTLSILPSLEIVEFAPMSVTNSAIDSDLPANTPTYLLTEAPSGAQIDAAGVIHWTPGEGEGGSTNVITTVVTDGGLPALSATNSFQVVVLETNNAPSLLVIQDLAIAEMSSITVTNTATDPDPAPVVLSYLLVTAPDGAAISANGLITWTPTEAQGPGTNVFRTAVIDNGTPPLSATNEFTVVVTEVNLPPVPALQIDRVIPPGHVLNITNTASDPDLPLNALTYVLTAAPGGAQISSNGIITWSPAANAEPSTNLITTVVTDDGAPPLSATNSFQVVVIDTNSAPTLPVIEDLAISELTAMTVTNTAVDLDTPQEALTYLLLTAPEGAAISTNGVITWTPTEAQGPTTNTFQTVVTDDGTPALSATNSFVVVVNEVNTPPTMNGFSNLAVDELSTLLLTVQASDTDLPANTITYSLLSGPPGALVDSGSGMMTWTPSEESGPGTNQFQVVAEDDGNPSLHVTNTFSIAVREVNTPPTLPFQQNRTNMGTATMVVTNTATDVDLPANVLAYQLVNAPTNAVIDANGVITWTPAAHQVSSQFTFTTIVTDTNPGAVNGETEKATNSFTVYVQNVFRRGPTLPVQSSITIFGATPITVVNTAFYSSVPATPLTYTLLSAPTNATISPNGVISWTPTVGQVPGTYLFETRVVDAGSPPWDDVNSFLVFVNPAPAPEVPILGPLAISNDVVTLTWSSLSNRTYRVEYKAALDVTNWTAIAPDVVATGSSTAATNSVTGELQRFYRVVLLP